MGALGAGNPLSFELGGGPSRVERIYASMRSAVGTGGSAEDGSLEAEWRLARARGWAASLDDERVMWQTWPDTADEAGVEVHERIMQIVPPLDSTLEDRRQAALTKMLRELAADSPSLLAALQNIDSSITLVDPSDRDTVTTTVQGRAFEDADPTSDQANGPAFFQVSQRTHTFFANYSQDFVDFVFFPIAVGPISKADQKKIFAIVDYLNEALPAWCQFQILTNTVGGVPACFTLDTDRLDISALC